MPTNLTPTARIFHPLQPTVAVPLRPCILHGMSFYCQKKLPPLKLTEHGAGTTKVLYRGLKDSDTKQLESSELGSTGGTDHSVSGGGVSSDLVGVLTPEPTGVGIDEAEPTHHELQSKSTVKGWEEIRGRLLVAVTECSAMPAEQVCLHG